MAALGSVHYDLILRCDHGEVTIGGLDVDVSLRSERHGRTIELHPSVDMDPADIAREITEQLRPKPEPRRIA